MTMTIDDRIRADLVDGHNSLPNALEVALKIHALLPDGIALGSLHIAPGRALGQLATYPRDDAYITSLLMWMAQKPGWSWKAEPPRVSAAGLPYIEIAAVTEMNGVTVELWDHIAANIAHHEMENGAAA